MVRKGSSVQIRQAARVAQDSKALGLGSAFPKEHNLMQSSYGEGGISADEAACEHRYDRTCGSWEDDVDGGDYACIVEAGYGSGESAAEF